MPTNTAQNSDTTSHDGQDAPTTSGWAEQVGTIVHVAPNALHLFFFLHQQLPLLDCETRPCPR